MLCLVAYFLFQNLFSFCTLDIQLSLHHIGLQPSFQFGGRDACLLLLKIGSMDMIVIFGNHVNFRKDVIML